MMRSRNLKKAEKDLQKTIAAELRTLNMESSPKLMKKATKRAGPLAAVSRRLQGSMPDVYAGLGSPGSSDAADSGGGGRVAEC